MRRAAAPACAPERGSTQRERADSRRRRACTPTSVHVVRSSWEPPRGANASRRRRARPRRRARCPRRAAAAAPRDGELVAAGRVAGGRRSYACGRATTRRDGGGQRTRPANATPSSTSTTSSRRGHAVASDRCREPCRAPGETGRPLSATRRLRRRSLGRGRAIAAPVLGACGSRSTSGSLPVGSRCRAARLRTRVAAGAVDRRRSPPLALGRRRRCRWRPRASRRRWTPRRRGDRAVTGRHGSRSTRRCPSAAATAPCAAPCGV